MKSPCNLRKYTQSITKCSSELPLEQEFRKKDDYRNGTMKVPLAWHSSKCIMTLAVRQSGVHRHSQLLVNLQPWQNASQAESEASENFILTGRDFALNILCHLGCANGILGKQYFTVPRNSTVDLWEKKPCHDTCNRAQRAWKGNNLACNACYVLGMNACGVLVGRQDLWIVGKRFLAIRLSVAMMPSITEQKETLIRAKNIT